MDTWRQQRGRTLPAWVVLLVVLLLQACGSDTMRVGPPVRLRSGQPASGCEAAQWIQLVPATSAVSEVEGGRHGAYGTTPGTTYTASGAGYALYRYGAAPGDAPLPLTEMLPQLGERRLARLHLAPIEEVRGRQRASSFVMAGAVGLIAAGVLTAVLAGSASSGVDEIRITGAILGGAGLLGLLASWIVRSPGPERVRATLRTRLLLPEEDDMRRVRRGVNRYNRAVRARCTTQEEAAPAVATAAP